MKFEVNVRKARRQVKVWVVLNLSQVPFLLQSEKGITSKLHEYFSRIGKASM
jgi:hypothetical protein